MNVLLEDTRGYQEALEERVRSLILRLLKQKILAVDTRSQSPLGIK
ncbi:MAG: hypothetical protein V7K55_15410 [Nostoc sp.]